MPRTLASALTAALIAGVSIVPGPWAPAAAAEEPAPPQTAITLAGGGRGASGPASRALLNSYSRIDAAPDGTLLVQDGVQLMRVDPARDSLTVIPWPDVTGAWGISDVAADGSSVVLATANHVKRIAPDGTVSYLWERSGIAALDIGSDHVVWAVQDNRVHRVLPDGTSTATAAGALVEPVDITVTPDGKKAFVLDIGSGHRGVFEVTAAGVGARVAGNLTAGGYFEAGLASTEANTAEARSLTTDGTTITLSSPYHEKVLSFPVGGGTLTQVASGPCAYAVARLGADVVAACVTGPGEASLRRYSAAGADRGRILGADPAQPWSPDGVRATDAYLGAVRGSAGLPDGRVVLTTEHGLVREVDADGRLRTRARLAPLAKRGKVALGADGTAYVVTDSGSVAAVTPAGTVTTVAADADAVDVEVLSDGALAIADASGARILRVPTTGPAAVLTDSIGTPVDLAREGDRLLVADGGLRRVDLAGAVSTVLSGGRPTMVTATDDGVWSNPDDGWGDVMVISPDGGMRPVAATGGPVAQLQAVGDGSALRGGGETVSRITSPNLGASIPALTLTATPGPGRITLDWGKPYAEVTIVAKRGTEAPRDRWDGTVLPMFNGRPESNVVMLIGGEPLTPGEDWSFAASSTATPPTAPPAPAPGARRAPRWRQPSRTARRLPPRPTSCSRPTGRGSSSATSTRSSTTSAAPWCAIRWGRPAGRPHRRAALPHGGQQLALRRPPGPGARPGLRDRHLRPRPPGQRHHLVGGDPARLRAPGAGQRRDRQPVLPRSRLLLHRSRQTATTAMPGMPWCRPVRSLTSAPPRPTGAPRRSSTTAWRWTPTTSSPCGAWTRPATPRSPSSRRSARCSTARRRRCRPTSRWPAATTR